MKHLALQPAAVTDDVAGGAAVDTLGATVAPGVPAGSVEPEAGMRGVTTVNEGAAGVRGVTTVNPEPGAGLCGVTTVNEGSAL